MLISLFYATRMTDLVASEHYSSLPTEQRQKALEQLAKKSFENSKNAPVYLQVELAKTTTSHLPFSSAA